MGDHTLETTVVGPIKNGFLARWRPFSSAAKVVWVIMAARTNNGESWPSVDSIQKDTGLSRGTVCKALRELRDGGEITDVHGGGRYGNKKYKLRTSLDSKLVQSVDSTSSNSDLTSPKSALAHNILKPDKEPDRNQTARGKAAAVDIPKELDSEIFRGAWKRWTVHRNELRKPLTPSTIKAQLKELTGWGTARAVDAIDRSIEGGYTGIFEKWQNGSGTPRVGPGQKFDPASATLPVKGGF